MATEMITFKLNDSFLKDVDNIVEQQGFQSRTEFIRNALREKVQEAKIKEAMIKLSKIKGISDKKTTDKDLEKIRDKVFDQLSSSGL